MFYLYIYLFLKSFAKKGNNLIPGNIQKKDDQWYYMQVEHTQVTWPIFLKIYIYSVRGCQHKGSDLATGDLLEAPGPCGTLLARGSADVLWGGRQRH